MAVAGGDGTVGKVARTLVGSRIPIAVLPMGTANNVARTLGLTGTTFQDLQDLIEGWNAARCVNFDVGVAKGPWGSKYFIEGFGVGLFAGTMFHIDDGQHSHVSHSEDPEEEIGAILKVLKKQLTNYSPKDLTVRLDGQNLNGDYFLLEALNVRYIGPNLDLAPRAEINDGFLDVVFVSRDEQAKLNQHISDRLKHKRSRANLTIRRGRHLQVECDSSPLHIDDMPWPEDKRRDPVLSNAIDIRADPGVLVFLTPRTARRPTRI